MRRPAVSFLAAAALASLAGACGRFPADRALERALSAVSADSLRAAVSVLADDAMEGRGTATPGYDRAAAWVAARFAALGLEPGGAGDGYLQPVPMVRADVLEETCALAFVRDGAARRLTLGLDYTMPADLLRARTALEAPVVFAGFGVVAPELEWDDYAGLDVRGKVVVVLAGAPRGFPADQRAYHSSRRLKQRDAAARGARGLLTLRTRAEEERTPWERQVRQSRLPALHWTDSSGAPFATPAELELEATLARRGAEALFEGASLPFATVLAEADSGRVARVSLAARVRAARGTALAPAQSPNVVGVIPGADPRLAGELVVVSGHLDHLGIGPPVNGDSIYNGAYDNASGISVMLEVARACAAMPRPRRTLVFLAVTGEEKGMQGSEYWARHPSVSGRAVANVNLDMFLMLHPCEDLVVFGAEHSSLGPAATRAAEREGLAVSPDPDPEQVIFIRSDQFAFIREGVPAVFPVAGRRGDAGTARARWMRTAYHSPQDDLEQAFDWGAGVEFARFVVRLVREVAEADAPPAWNPGDFFGEAFGGERPSADADRVSSGTR
jgi:hypothetical protein